MFSRAAVRATTKVAGRRGFHATRSQMSSPYHYAEGPYTNLPFNPKKKGFPILFWGYAITGFGAPFAIAGASYSSMEEIEHWLTFLPRSLANLQAPDVNRDPEWVCGSGLVYKEDGVELGLGRRGLGAWIDSTIDVLSNRVFLGLPSVLRPRAPDRCLLDDHLSGDRAENPIRQHIDIRAYANGSRQHPGVCHLTFMPV